MDWATFFKDNSASIFTLVGVFLGSAITFLISYLNNKFEAKERDKDREEKRREAQIQAREKWIEKDILKIMDSIESLLKVFSEAHLTTMQQYILLNTIKDSDSITDELVAQFNRGLEIRRSLFEDMKRTMDVIQKLVYSFEEIEIYSFFRDFVREANSFVDEINHYFDILLIGEWIETNEPPSLLEVNKTAGRFQKTLREKLISLRDT